jgi:hypothetical protein
MEGFKVDIIKMDVHSDEMKDFGKMLRETQEGISSIRGDLRHKLSAAEDIGNTLRKIEENMEAETVMMLGLCSALGTITGYYRNSERGIMDFGTNHISGSQLSDLQREALEYENGVTNGEEKDFFVEIPHYFRGAGIGQKSFSNNAKGLANFVGETMDSAWNNTVIRALENIGASLCELLSIDNAEIDPNGPLAKVINIISDKIKDHEILSEITGDTDLFCDVLNFVADYALNGNNDENFVKFLKIVIPISPLWDILSSSSSGTSSQGGKYRIDTGY